MLTWFRRRLAAEDGVSLVETMWAIMILAIVLFGLTSASMGALAGTKHAQDQVAAAQLLNEVVEDLRAQPFADIAPTAWDGTETPAYGPYVRRGVTYNVAVTVAWEDDVCNGQGAPVDPTRPDPRMDYLVLDVTVSWQVDGQDREFNTVSYRAPTYVEQPVERGDTC